MKHTVTPVFGAAALLTVAGANAALMPFSFTGTATEADSGNTFGLAVNDTISVAGEFDDQALSAVGPSTIDFGDGNQPNAMTITLGSVVINEENDVNYTGGTFPTLSYLDGKLVNTNIVMSEGVNGSPVDFNSDIEWVATDALGNVVSGPFDFASSPTPPEPTPPEPTPIDPVEVLENIAFTSNTSSTANAIGTACPEVAGTGTQFSQDCTTLVVAAASQVPQLEQESAAALTAVTAEQATIPLSSSRASLSTQLQNLASRLAALRSGATGLSIRGLSTASVTDGTFGFTGGAASADGESTMIFGNERVGAFINGTYSTGDKDPTLNEDGFNFDSWGFTAGVDYRFTQDLVVGLAIGYGENDTNIDNSGGSLDTDTFSTSLYGTFFVNEQIYVDGIVTYSNNDYDQKRNINYAIGNTPVRQVAKADYDGSQWSAAIGGGYQLSNGPWSYGPTARLEYVSASVDGYSEKMSNPGVAGGGWAARLNDLDQDSFTSSIGFDVSRAVSMEWGVLSPQLNLSWIHEFEDDALNINGVFVEDPNRNQFGIASDRPDSDYFNGRFAVAAQLAGGTSAFIYYNKVFGYKDLDVDTFGAGVRLTF
jgi:outer membrane lipase/esterase